MKSNLILLVLLSIIFISCESEIKVACVGDSITNGGGKNQSSFYPSQLDNLLGEGYQVLNCGESGATMQSDGNKPYWNQKDLHNVFVYAPDIVVIMLGTNDSKTNNWNASSYERNYQLMIDTLNTLASKPQIYLCSPPPAYSSAWSISDSTIRYDVIPIVEGIAKRNNLQIIDVYNGMNQMSDLFPDGIHPNEKGINIMAEIVAKSIDK
ncbi:GDSL-type esterase/lipase family protein [Labilibaculum sp. DW002]|uniref:GDSL-type esterase/lipase family protein n=1 Tax=Paralabilibaculum antarcticum TaxID=2912572 RepID=A0ABT5VRU8_9BACT|nr:GDSL-type esterase/lipase family protein [Labilibaculum sp. DW002]MDE5418006.1 GDSL-type esterase/lipase family protein [Labilibaculum sp. DW002]